MVARRRSKVPGAGAEWDFALQRVGAETVATSRLRLAYDPRGNRAVLTFDGNGGGGELASGLYKLALKADGVTDGAGNKLDGDFNGTAGGDYVIYFRKV